MKRLGAVLAPKFYARPTLQVAADLIGKLLCHETAEGLSAGLIVEVEAYLGTSDPASHAARGPTPRSQIMFDRPGVAYVYFSYGTHCCMNVVCEKKGTAGAVLIRALEPIYGIELMTQRRGLSLESSLNLTPKALTQLCSGPGKLTQALGIGLADNGSDLRRSKLVIRETPDSVLRSKWPLVKGPRIGISRAIDLPYRFFLEGSPYISGSRAFNARATRHTRR